MTNAKTLLLTTTALLCASPALAEMITVSEATESALTEAFAQAAAADAPSTITLDYEGDVEIAATLDYTGTAPLTLLGNGGTISTAQNVTLLQASQGADLTVSDITLQGPGGFSIENRGDLDGPAGKGIFVDVRDDQTGLVTLSLNNVTVRDVANHGVHVSDCSLADDCGAGAGGGGEGSEASIALVLQNLTIDAAGIGKFDADGLRVDERGLGSITATIENGTFVNVGADGVELDEGNEGDVSVVSVGSTFNTNGNYCDPAILDSFLPSPVEGEFEEGAQAEDGVPGPVTGSPDDSCIEREVDLYDDGSVEEFAFGLDLDDGFDIDEDGPGTLRATMFASVIDANLDEGLDFDEAGEGNIELTLIGAQANGNRDDGYKLSEEDEGDVLVTITQGVAMDNGGKGFVFEEEGAGDLAATVAGSTATGNDDSDDTGIEAVQEDDGMGTLSVLSSDIADGFDLDGVN